MEILSWLKIDKGFKSDRLTEQIQQLVIKDKQCQGLISRIENTYGFHVPDLDLKNLSSYFYIDLLEKAFEGVDVEWPDEIRILDVGTGDWHYAPALLAFLKKWNGNRRVNLHGIDFPIKQNIKAIRRLQNNIGLKMHWGDVMNFNSDVKYDLVLLNHMLTGANHCRKWKVPYYPLSKFLSHVQTLGSKEGLITIAAHVYAGESSILNCFQNKVTEFYYFPEVSENLGRFLNGYFGFHDNMVCLCKAPYVNLKTSQEHDEEMARLDRIFKNL